MPPTAVSPDLVRRLQQRETELRDMLRDTPPPDTGHEVVDFKEMAEQETAAAVDTAQAAQAQSELAQVIAALERTRDGSYGECLDCGETIAPQRLAALPWTPLCTACQTRREEAGRRP